jgi:ATP-binding cassette subfamily B protein
MSDGPEREITGQQQEEENPINLPEEARAQVERALQAGEELRVAAEADMALPGVFAPTWLVLTDRRLAVFGPNGGSAHTLAEVPLQPGLLLNKREYISNSLLEAETGETVVPLLRYTHARDDAMERAVETIQELLPAGGDSVESAGEEVDGEDEEKKGPSEWIAKARRRRKRDICPKCGKPMPKWMGVCPDCLDKRALLVRLMHRLRPYWRPAALAFGMSLAATGMDLYQAPLQRTLVDSILPTHLGPHFPLEVAQHLRSLAFIFLLLLVIRAGNAVLGAARTFIMSAFGERLTFDLRRDVYDHLQKLTISYYDQKDTGWIMDRVTSDTGNLQSFMTDGFQRTVLNIITCGVIIVMMLWMDWQLALLSLLPAPIVVIMSSKFMGETRKLYHWTWRRRAAVFSLLSNVIPGVRVVKAFAQEEREGERFVTRSAAYMNSNISVARTFAGFNRSTGFVMALSTLIIWGYGGYLVIMHVPGATIGTLIAFMTLVARFYAPLQELTQLSRQIQQAATSASRVFEVLDTQPDMQDAPGAPPMPRIEGKVEFKDVSFGYDDRNQVMKGVSFTVQPGEMIGLVGPSGAGKSTTINLLCRFYDVTGGSIEIDGIDIRDVQLHSLRRQIGIVLQEPFLFVGSVADNIAYGRPEATMEEIMQAAQAANAHEFIIRFPDGYDTMVGERGTRLSGGERQRISIARAILKDPRILIFDEATASVDTETEHKIREAIDRLVSGRTTFAIAHRFSTLKNADRLIVLEKGKVVEMGTHEELMAKEEGVFRRLCDMQSEMSRIVAVS